MFLVVIYYIIFSITVLYGLYFIVCAALGFVKPKSKRIIKKTNKENYFAILVPARNEEKVIANLVESLKKQNYNKEKYKIYVVVNNCTDNTKENALKAGAEVLECQEKVKTKGETLRWAFSNLKDNKKIDAYVIFDADNIAHPDFLKNMNLCLESGYNVAQGCRDAKNPSDNWISGSYSLFYLFQNTFYNATRMNLIGTSAINGTGFMIRKSLIDNKGFYTFTLTEDLEFTGQCSLTNEKIAYVENAITYDEYPIKFESSWKQRVRWSVGINSCRRMYFNQLLKKSSFQAIDTLLVYAGPLMQVISFFNMLLLVILKISSFNMINDTISNLLIFGLINFLTTYVITIVGEIVIVLLCKKNPLKMFTGILLFPLFLCSWIPINISCLLKKDVNWEHIEHNRNVNINDILK